MRNGASTYTGTVPLLVGTVLVVFGGVLSLRPEIILLRGDSDSHGSANKEQPSDHE